jgi:hypothetical protein
MNQQHHIHTNKIMYCDKDYTIQLTYSATQLTYRHQDAPRTDLGTENTARKSHRKIEGRSRSDHQHYKLAGRGITRSISGFFALRIYLPYRTKRVLTKYQSFFGYNLSRSWDAFVGSVLVVRP